MSHDSHTGWLTSELLKESVRYSKSSMWRMVILFLFVTALAFTLAWSELQTTGRLIAFEENRRDSGGEVVIVRGGSLGELGERSCLSLMARNDVIYSGAVSDVSFESLSNNPGAGQAVVAATPGAVRIWSSEAVTDTALAHGVVVGESAAARFGLAASSRIATATTGTSRVGGVLKTGERFPQANSWIVDVRGTLGVPVRDCWVEFRPGFTDVGLSYLPAWMWPAQAQVERLVPVSEFDTDTIAEFESRPQRLAWLALGLTFGLLCLLISWSRRDELALYRALGSNRRDLLVIHAVSTSIFVVGGSLQGVAWALINGLMLRDMRVRREQLEVVWHSVSSFVLLAIVVGSLLPQLVTTRSTLDLLKGGE